MRKIILVTLVIALAIAAGFASTRLRKPQLSAIPHTIVYRVTDYDESGNVAGTSVVVRQVLSDGKWKHTQIMSDGRVLHSNGQLKNVVTLRAADPNLPEHLHFKYFEDNNRSTETWVSPQLQDYLKLTTLRANGSKISSLEALDITTP
jgi:ABC-type lipoprotein release transport system permease subunit